MSKILAGLAVLAALVVLALPAPASAATRTDGVRNVEEFDFSSHRRRYRHRHHVRRYYAPAPFWWGGWGHGPYYGYAYPGPRVYYHPGRPWPWW